MSNNVTVQQDNNTTDAPGSASGTITAGAPVQSAGSVAEQQQRAAQRASDAGAACGGTAQAYNVTVPYSGTTMCFGSAAGGAGASLTTLGQVLLDAVGTMGLQAKGNFSAQTNAAMALLSAASTQQHSQGKVEIFAGGGMAPGSCGSGAPASPGPNTPPAKTAEKVTEVACAATSAMKAYNDLQTNLQSSRDAEGKFSSATTTAERDALSQEGFAADLGIMKAGMDALKAGTGAGSQFASGAGKDALKVGGSVLEAGAGMAGAMSAMMKGDIGSAVSGLSGMVSGGAGVAAAAGGGGGADIEERASANIKMVAATKISGTAPVGIDFKTANKFSVNAALVVDFTTITWGAFAAAKFEVKSMGAVKTASSTLEMKAKATGKIDCKGSFTAKAPLISIDGVTTVTKTLTVKGDTTLNANLQVDKNATLKGELLVQKKTTLKSSLTVHKASTLKGSVTAEKSLTVKSDATVNGKLRAKGAVMLG